MTRTRTSAPTRNATRRRRPNDLAGRLRRAGQRVTAQRLVILGALRAGEHVSAEEILTRIEDKLPAINRSTVYRTLETFRDLGLVSETDLGGGVRRFELIEERRHHHLICHHCGAIAEFEDELVEPLRQSLRTEYGFAASVDHLAIFGTCAICGGDASGIQQEHPA
jgi:Fur family transcriptional regulator, ferric uptake regulator